MLVPISEPFETIAHPEVIDDVDVELSLKFYRTGLPDTPSLRQFVLEHESRIVGIPVNELAAMHEPISQADGNNNSRPHDQTH